MAEAHYHSVLPLLYQSLRATCPEGVPPSVLKQLSTFSRANGLRNFALSNPLLSLLRLFTAQGIPAIPYTGPVFAATVYGHLALRTFGDLDMLVPQKDIPTITSLLLAQGYRWKPRIGHLLRAKTGRYVRSSYLYDVSFEQPDKAGHAFPGSKSIGRRTPHTYSYPSMPSTCGTILSRCRLATGWSPP